MIRQYRKRGLAIILLIIFGISVLTAGCSSSDSIVGTWKEADSDAEMSFYEDGTCLDVPVETDTSADAVSYKMQDDGKLIFTMEWDGPEVREPAETKEEALDDYDLYYLSGDTLVLSTHEYTRQ